MSSTLNLFLYNIAAGLSVDLDRLEISMDSALLKELYMCSLLFFFFFSKKISLRAKAKTTDKQTRDKKG